MLFKNILTTIVVASVTTLVQGIDVCAWPDTLGCDGAALCCVDLVKNACCSPLPQTVGFSISYDPLESSVAFGQAWTSTNCGAGGIGTNQVGPGDRCWVGVGVKANSMAWANFGDPRRSASTDGNITETIPPNAFVFTNKGVQKAIRIPKHPGAVDTLFDLYKKGDFATLESYETIERTGEYLISYSRAATDQSQRRKRSVRADMTVQWKETWLAAFFGI